MKRLSIVVVIALLFGMTQCKKTLETASEVTSDGVYIKLNVSQDSRVIVDPSWTPDEYASVTFEEGDVVYVGNNGAYCGYLTCNNEGVFGGTINPTSGYDEDYLHFYFMGNKGPQSEPESVSITDQTSKYPVISYGRSTNLYDPEVNEYETILNNKCSIMQFDTRSIQSDVVISGMNNTVTVDFSKNKGKTAPVNPYTYTKSGDGSIILHREADDSSWAIVLPQDEVSDAKATARGYTSSEVRLDQIEPNCYYYGGVKLPMVETGAIDSKFTVAAGQQVNISRGNLQAYNSTANSTDGWIWSFAEHQFDFIGNNTANNAIESNSISTPGSVDWFGWVGANSSLAAYGINKNQSDGDYGGVAGEDIKSDWGHNRITNGGDEEDIWRTPTKEEWVYLLTTRTDATQKYASGYVNGIRGLILLPDEWTLPEGLGFYPGKDASKNVYTYGEWLLMEHNGAVFLPSAGARYGQSQGSLGVRGYYWSRTSANYSDFAYHLLVSDYEIKASDYFFRCYGCSVRLIRNAN